MSSPVPSIPSPTSEANQAPDVSASSPQSDDDNRDEKDSLAPRCPPITCNGVIQNTSLPTLSTLAQSSSSPPGRRKNVSTVFSSSHRKSWQRSLSNYSHEKTKDSSPSPDNRELHELQSTPLLHHHPETSFHSSESVSHQTEEKLTRSHSGEAVGPDPGETSGDPELGQGRGVYLGQGQCVVCECGEQACRCGEGEAKSGNQRRSPVDSVDSSKEMCHLLMEEERSGRPYCAAKAESDSVPLTQCHQQDPYHLRHHSHPSRNNDLSQSSRQADCEPDSIELSEYSRNTVSRLYDNNPVEDIPGTATSDAQYPKPSTSASPSCSQSVSVLQTGSQSNSVSISSSHRKRKDSDSKGKVSSGTEHRDNRQKRKGNHKEQHGAGKRVHRQGTRTSEGAPDTQPLLSTPQVRVERGGASLDSSELSAENSPLPRFHSLDSREACSRGSAGSGSHRTASASPYQRALSVNTPSTTPNVPTPTHLAAHLALDSSHLLVENVRAGSPASSESLGAPPLNELYRYHVFLSHCPEDLGWVQDMVARLGSPPYGYQCVFTPEEEKVVE